MGRLHKHTLPMAEIFKSLGFAPSPALAFKVARRNLETGRLHSLYGDGTFEEGETVTVPPSLEEGSGLSLCMRGIHACPAPFNCFRQEYGYNIFDERDVLMVVSLDGDVVGDKRKKCTVGCEDVAPHGGGVDDGRGGWQALVVQGHMGSQQTHGGLGGCSLGDGDGGRDAGRGRGGREG